MSILLIIFVGIFGLFLWTLEEIDAAYKKACEDNNVEDILKLGIAYANEGGSLMRKISVAFQKARKVEAILSRMKEAIRQNNDLQIAEIWHMNYEYIHDTRTVISVHDVN